MSIPWCPIALPVIRGHRLPVCARAETAVGQERTKKEGKGVAFPRGVTSVHGDATEEQWTVESQ